MRLRPMNDWVLIQVDPKKESKTPTGIILVENNKNYVLTGTVLEVGRGKNGIPVGVEVGEKVAFFSANFDTTIGEQIQETIEKYQEGVGLVRADSILFAFVEGEQTIEFDT